MWGGGGGLWSGFYNYRRINIQCPSINDMFHPVTSGPRISKVSNGSAEWKYQSNDSGGSDNEVFIYQPEKISAVLTC